MGFFVQESESIGNPGPSANSFGECGLCERAGLRSGKAVACYFPHVVHNAVESPLCVYFHLAPACKASSRF